ncbi:MAG: peptidase U32 family protein, partial [Desulfovibrionaceae bacterium]
MSAPTTLPPRRPELLVPAGNREKLETAIAYGADAVYLGAGSMNLRAAAGGFSAEELPSALRLARVHGVRAYYLLNALPRQPHLGEVRAQLDLLAALADQGRAPDGLIVADPGVLRMARAALPDMPLHVSTQANTANAEAALFWREAGARRVNVSREMRAPELKDMLLACKRLDPPMEVEVFVHGAQCMALSGRCYLSSYLNDRPANLGQCTHPCRYEYEVSSIGVREKTREEETLWEVREYWSEHTDAGSEGAPVPSAEGYSAFFAAHDLCLLHYLDWMRRAGVAAVKLEGRTKSSSYLAQVTDAYATALRDLLRQGRTFTPERYLGELVNAATRPLNTGFFDPGGQRVIAEPPSGEDARPVLARIVEGLGPGRWLADVKHRWRTRDDRVEILLPGLRRPRLSSDEFGVETEEGQGLMETHSGQRVVLHCDRPELSPGIFLRRA